MMTKHLGIHEELQRIILRQRWLCWAFQRPFRLGESAIISHPYYVMLADRLVAFRPTWIERNQEESEM